MSLLQLSNEIVFIIWESLDSVQDRNSFLQTHRRFYNLLDQFLYPYALKVWGDSPLLSAARRGHAAAVQKLLKEGADVNISGPQFNTGAGCSTHWSALAFAASRGYESVVQVLLASDGVDTNIKNSEERTPLDLAAINGRDKVIPLLLAHGKVEPNMKNMYGRTALMEASFRGYTAVTKQLLASEKVNPNVMGGLTPPLPPPVELQYDYDRHGFGLLLNEVEYEISLKARSKMMEMRKYGRTALSWATERGHEGVVRLLLADSRVNVDLYDANGHTPIDWADKQGHRMIRELLAEHSSAKLRKAGNYGELSRNAHTSIDSE